MKLPNSVFDTLKWLVLVFIPALTTLYVSLSAIWQFPYAEEVAKAGFDSRSEALRLQAYYMNAIEEQNR